MLLLLVYLTHLTMYRHHHLHPTPPRPSSSQNRLARPIHLLRGNNHRDRISMTRELLESVID